MATIELITSPTCPYCPAAKKAIPAFVNMLRHEGMEVEYAQYSTDTEEGAKKMQEYDVNSVPTVVVKGSAHSLMLESYSYPNLQQACLVADGKKPLKK